MSERKLNWERSDIENKFGFHGKKYTGVNFFFSLLLGIVFGLAFYGALYPFFRRGDIQIVNMFFHGGPQNRSIIPYFIIFLSSWSLAILFIKSRKLAFQKKALTLDLVPQDPDFVLAASSAEPILESMIDKVNDPKQFLLLNRIQRAISNLKNIGKAAIVPDVMAAQAENDENYIESTYTLIKGYIWAIPVLGFIGTVLGLSEAIGGFGKVVSQGADIDKLKSSLSGVTAGLAVAFETTLIALVAALIIQLLLTMLKKQEEDFLDECSDYCHRNILSRLRLTGIRQEYDDEEA